MATHQESTLCNTHGQQVTGICCITCEVIPVCNTCIAKEHINHDLHDIRELAEREVKLLKLNLAELNIQRRKVHQLSRKVTDVERKLKENVSRKKEIVLIRYLRLNHEITDAWKKSEALKEEASAKGRVESELEEKIRNTYIKRDRSNAAIDQLHRENINKLHEIAFHCEEVNKRCEDLKRRASTILSSRVQLEKAQLIPEIRKTVYGLLEDMKKEFPYLDSLSDFSSIEIAQAVTVDVDITETEEHYVKVDVLKSKRGWGISGIVGSENGNIVVTGRISDKYSHVTVINSNGTIRRQDRVKDEMGSNTELSRYCAYLLPFTTVTASSTGTVCLYDVQHGSHAEKKVRDIPCSWPANQLVKCVAVDPIRRHIILGTNSRNVHVYDFQIVYSHSFSLPEGIKGSFDITVHKNDLIICDYIGKKACAVSIMEREEEQKVIHEFIKPGEGDWRPISTCTDGSGYIYMLWNVSTMSQSKCVLAQYSPDGRRLLRRRYVNINSRCVSTICTDRKEKLLIATGNSGKLYVYGLHGH